jgi:feruloyl esterase
MEAQRYPEDYDGVVAGAPVYDITIQTSAFERGRRFSEAPERRISQAQAALLNRAALAACDADDGVEDGVITDAAACDFDPRTLVCATAHAAPESCLTPAQADAMQALYEGITLPDGRVVSQPIFKGGELSWSFATGGPGDPVVAQEKGAAVFLGEFGVDYTTLTPEQLLDRVSSTRFAGMYSAGNPDLSAFFNRGGRILIHHGTMDSLANPPATISYYEKMVETTAPLIEGDVRDHARLFVMPGTGHCGGGPGANSADWLGAIAAWMETGQAPDQLPATRTAGFGPPQPDQAPLERPICAWPELPRYQSGDPERPESFTCG